jgi:Na+/alanine symporter
VRLVDLDRSPLQHWALDQYFLGRLPRYTNFTEYARLFLMFVVIVDGAKKVRKATEKKIPVQTFAYIVEEEIKKETLKAI